MYNVNTYQQNDSLEIGIPTSAIISETFVQHLAKKIHNIIKNLNRLRHYYIHLDDTLCLSQFNEQILIKLLI